MTLNEFNVLDERAAIAQLCTCCHCKGWAQRVAALRPYSSFEQLLFTADQAWGEVDEAQILEAFSGHARIGDIELLRSRYAGHARREQGQVVNASDEVLQELHALNTAYQTRNDFIFIVCASGKSAEEMLMLLKARIHNDRARELINGAREQAAITRLRLQQLFCQ